MEPQVKDIILPHKLHKVIVNTQIPLMFKTECDQIANIISESCESWIVQDQTLFTWLLSRIFEGVLPRTLSYKHAFEVRDKVQNTTIHI